MTSSSTTPSPPKEGVDFETLPWNLNCPEDHAYIHLTTQDEWTSTHYDFDNDSGLLLNDDGKTMKKYSSNPLELNPATTSLNYGTTIWEGLKAFRREDGSIAVFRPDMNYQRFARGAEAMCLPVPSFELFMRSIQHVIQTNSDLVPPYGEGMKLYVRPMLLGSGQQLGLYPSQEFSLLFYVSPTGNYFSAKTSGLNLHLETKRSRAARGGTGNVKCSGNYAVALRPLMDAKAEGFDDNLFLELETYHEKDLSKAIVQELSAANIFVVLKNGEIVTPCLKRGTILPGVTRDSIVKLIHEYGKDDILIDAMKESTGNSDISSVTITERDVCVGEFDNATEAFVTGTAAEVVPIAKLATGTQDEDSYSVEFEHGKNLPGGPITSKLLELLREIMTGKLASPAFDGWTRDPYTSPSEFCKK